jgi:hypothetical protein
VAARKEFMYGEYVEEEEILNEKEKGNDEV